VLHLLLLQQLLPQVLLAVAAVYVAREAASAVVEARVGLG
jgi:hypothetical protein